MDMLYQFEQISPKTKSINVEMSSGYIQMSMEPDLPIFTKTQKDFTPSAPITHVAISNKYLVVAMANNMLFRMDLKDANHQDEITLSKYMSNGAVLKKLFLDPFGKHMLLTFGGIPTTVTIEKKEGDVVKKIVETKPSEVVPELMYLSRKTSRLKASAKFRGHEVTAVAWNYNNESDSTTGCILIGTSKGLIFETEIMPEGEKFFPAGFSSSLEQYWRQVFDIGKGSDTPITGLEYFNLSGSKEHIVLATTPKRLYYFSGEAVFDEKPPLQQVFNKYLNIPEIETFLLSENSTSDSQLKFWSANLVTPNSFAWLTDKIKYAQFDPFIIKDTKSFKVEEIVSPKSSYEHSNNPFAIAVTEFHVLIAYRDSVKAVSLLNSELVHEDNYNEAFGRVIDIVKDHIAGTIWVVTENAIFRYKITKEERNVWRIYADKQEFDLAKVYAFNNEAHYNVVLIKEANMLFEQKQYELSAGRYSETMASFEEICLKFIQAEQQSALKIFLRKKLDKLKTHEQTQITMIVLWLVELYLNELEELRLQDKEQTEKFNTLQKEFQMFLAHQEVHSNIKRNKSSIYNLMASHGDKNNAIELTIVCKDFEKLICQHIYKNSFHEALGVLKSQDSSSLFYQFAPILMQEIPKQVVKALIRQGGKLKPVKLLPALVSSDSEQHSLEIIKYLEYCVSNLKCKEKAIHNLLLSLYARYDEKKLMEYLNQQSNDILLVNYDVYFALRQCQEKKLTQACVQLSGLLGLWESAVDLALTINKDLAVQIANQPPQGDVELRKKLWLKIAKHVVSGKDDIQTAMEFLHECDLIKIEDILPFFSDFVTIDHFKKAICNSLEEYNHHIEDLKEEMEEATKSAEVVRKEIQSFRNRYTFISDLNTCEVCGLTLMVRPFYMFPCKHRFHADCLLQELSPMLGPAKRNKLSDLKRQLNILSTQTIDNISTGSTGMSAKDTVKADIDNIVASECLYCGENMIRNIDLPFYDECEYESILNEWA